MAETAANMSKYVSSAVKKHPEEECHDSPKCVNCDGPHPAFSRTCPIFIHEREIQKLRVTENISFIEAKRGMEATAESSKASYANVASKPQMKSTQTQTDLSWDASLGKFHSPLTSASRVKPLAVSAGTSTNLDLPQVSGDKVQQSQKPSTSGSRPKPITAKQI